MKDFKKYLFQDETGKYVIGQPPNVLVYVIVLAWVIGKLDLVDWLTRGADVVMIGAVFAWSYLEIRFGESKFRQILGVTVLTLTIVGRALG